MIWPTKRRGPKSRGGVVIVVGGVARVLRQRGAGAYHRGAAGDR